MFLNDYTTKVEVIWGKEVQHAVLCVYVLHMQRKFDERIVYVWDICIQANSILVTGHTL